MIQLGMAPFAEVAIPLCTAQVIQFCAISFGAVVTGVRTDAVVESPAELVLPYSVREGQQVRLGGLVGVAAVVAGLLVCHVGWAPVRVVVMAAGLEVVLVWRVAAMGRAGGHAHPVEGRPLLLNVPCGEKRHFSLPPGGVDAQDVVYKRRQNGGLVGGGRQVACAEAVVVEETLNSPYGHIPRESVLHGAAEGTQGGFKFLLITNFLERLTDVESVLRFIERYPL